MILRNKALLHPLLVALLLTAAACASPTPNVDRGPELDVITPDALASTIADAAMPAVVNIWASWCIPCRSEAPLLGLAHEKFDGQVTFIGVSVADSQDGARDFIAEFGIEYANYFDRVRSIPASFGRIGVPITFFFDSDGSMIYAHSGVIDERTLAINIDELLAR